MYVSETPRDLPFEMDESSRCNHGEEDYGFFYDESLSAGLELEESVVSDHILDDDDDDLKAFPPILSTTMVQQIVDDGLPWSMQDTQWKRLFSSSKDGDSFGSFLRKVRGHRNTIIVAKTKTRIVGGFATEPWSGRKTNQNMNDGTVKPFLFSTEEESMGEERNDSSWKRSFIPGYECLSPTSTIVSCFGSGLSLSSTDGKERLNVHKGCEPAQLCQMTSKRIALGEGDDSGSFGLCIDGCFSRLSTTGPLSKQEGADIIDFEVYCLLDEF